MGLKEQYPGTVIGCVSKSSPTFAEDIGKLIDEARRLATRSIKEVIDEKVRTYGSAVLCDNGHGLVVKGYVSAVLDTGVVVVIDHEDDEMSYWIPEFVRFLG